MGSVCASGGGAHQKIGESDSWSSSWSAPLIRSEWQESTGPHRYLPSCCRTLPTAPIWPLTSPTPATMSIPFWLLKPLLLPKWWTFESGAFISIKSLPARHYTSTLSLFSSHLCLWPPLCCPSPSMFACPSRVAAPLSTRRHKPVRCVFTMTTWKPWLPTAPCLMHSGVAPVKCFRLSQMSSQSSPLCFCTITSRSSLSWHALISQYSIHFMSVNLFPAYAFMAFPPLFTPLYVWHFQKGFFTNW